MAYFKDLRPGDQFLLCPVDSEINLVAIYTKLNGMFVEQTIYAMALDGLPIDRAELRLNAVSNYGSLIFVADMDEVHKIVTFHELRDH